jgi:hypothetical protein
VGIAFLFLATFPLLASEGTVELCMKKYIAAVNANSNSDVLKRDCLSKKFSSEWDSLIKKTNADPLLLAQDTGPDWGQISVESQGKGIYQVQLGKSHCLLLSVISGKIDSSKNCAGKR